MSCEDNYAEVKNRADQKGKAKTKEFHIYLKVTEKTSCAYDTFRTFILHSYFGWYVLNSKYRGEKYTDCITLVSKTYIDFYLNGLYSVRTQKSFYK